MSIDTNGRVAMRGECRYCGCWERDPCVITLPLTGATVGCWWMDAAQTICSMPACQKQAIAEGLLPPLGVIAA